MGRLIIDWFSGILKPGCHISIVVIYFIIYFIFRPNCCCFRKPESFVTIIGKLYSYLVIADSERFNNKYLTLEKFYSKLSKSNDICSKPFKPTCNRDKIYLTLRSLEDKIDELEYKLYRKHREKQRGALNAEGKKRAQNIQRMVSRDTRRAEQDRKKRERKARELENKRCQF